MSYEKEALTHNQKNLAPFIDEMLKKPEVNQISKRTRMALVNTIGLRSVIDDLFSKYPAIPDEIRCRYRLSGIAKLTGSLALPFEEYVQGLEEDIASHCGNWLVPLYRLPMPTTYEQHMVISGLYAMIYSHFYGTLKDHYLAFRTTLLHEESIKNFHQTFVARGIAQGERSLYYVTDYSLFKIAKTLIKTGECDEYESVTVKNHWPAITLS